MLDGSMVVGSIVVGSMVVGMDVGGMAYRLINNSDLKKKKNNMDNDFIEYVCLCF